jgi:voltage-gated potassium channel Kch
MRERLPPAARRGQLGPRRAQVVRALDLAVIAATLATIPLVLAHQQGVESGLVVVGDWLTWAVFVVDYVVLLRIAADRPAFIRGNWPRALLILVSFPILYELVLQTELVDLQRALPIVRLVLVTWVLLEALRLFVGRRRLVYVAAVAAVFVLAGGGLIAILEPDTVENGFWDGVWWAVVTVTTVGYGDITPKTPGGRTLGVMLMVAGIGLVSTVAASLAAYFVEQDVNAERRETARRLSHMVNHVVICGLGRKGMLLARGFLERGYNVVAIELDETNLSIADLRQLGAIVLTGDATDPELLARARVLTAEDLIAVCGDDDTNADVVIHTNELVRDRAGDPLQGLAHIVDPLLCDLFKRLEVGAVHTGGFRLQFFNVFDGAARALLQAHPPFDPGGSEPVGEVLVVGLGHIGQRLIFNLGRNWRERYRASGERLGITIVDKDADRVQETLTTRHPQLATLCTLTAHAIEHRSAAFHLGRFLRRRALAPDSEEAESRLDELEAVEAMADQAALAPGFSVVYVALQDDAASLSAALELRQKIHDLSVPVVACMDESTGLVRLLEGVDGTANRIEGLRAFRVLDQTCTPALLLDSTNEILARAHHEDFLRHELAAGHTAATNSSIVPWDELPEEKRESSRQAVDHIPVKLHAVGCDVEPMTDWDAELFEFTPAEIETLAEMEHERWMAERTRGGYTYGPIRDDVAHTHPDLLPWGSLSEEAKDKDRTFIRGLPAYLAGVGFQVIRR